MKIALLFRSYGPYHLARLAAVRQYHSVLALEYSDIDADYGWEVAAQKRDAGVIALSNPRGAEAFAKRLTAELGRFMPDAVAIPGYAEPFALAALRTCNALNIPAILMSDTHAGSVSRNRVREALKRQLVQLYRAAFVAGTPHAEFLVSLGFPAHKIATGFDTIDNAHFAKASENTSEREALKQANLPKSFFLCCARLVSKKNLPFLIEAYARYRSAHSDQPWDLVIAGDGPLREAVTDRASELSVTSSVHLLGHKSYAALPGIYARAGAFVLPSIVDEWGLVVNEAMAAGLPVLVSEGAGCQRDLVEGGVNGFSFDPRDAGELARLLAAVATSSNREEMGAASRRIISEWDLGRFVQGLTQAVDLAKRPRGVKRLHMGAAVATALSIRI
ncbi:glycosyltransferase [Hyphomicrobium sp.]|uniref:glycosyltransferase n=1 Tax=Hyphomicrobium sp. TaxID=82 RepID=UPI002D79060B|nr:glycosyltransferase [Hyphomicrobium sp.]HET6389275.1 glycosyltransferase [Hyphomicrobium sp.]